MKKILIASDHAGFGLKEKIKSHLSKLPGIRAQDLGTHTTERCDYPVYGYTVARLISKKKYSRGILICKSGIGMAVVANRLPGVRAALCYNKEAARLSREHNDSNVLVFGSGFVSAQKAKEIINVWLKTKFEGGRHRRRLDLIRKIEKEIAKT